MVPDVWSVVRRYAQLLSDGQYTDKEMRARGLVPVHPDFRILALGLPVPPHPGHTLDPPLRSRFQAKVVVSDLGHLWRKVAHKTTPAASLGDNLEKLFLQVVEAINSVAKNRIPHVAGSSQATENDGTGSLVHRRELKTAARAAKTADARNQFLSEEVSLPEVPHDQVSCEGLLMGMPPRYLFGKLALTGWAL